MKKTLFISHATPEDNGFTIWLASRLQLAGYTVWSDINGLIGGEKHWDIIDDQIRNNAIKYLLVVSSSIFIQPGKLKEGIDDEFKLAKSIAKNVHDEFIIPLKIDSTPYNNVIGLNNYNHINFDFNWATGLKNLIKKLNKDNVPNSQSSNSELYKAWYESEFTLKYKLLNKLQKYFSNLWSINDLPEYYFLYEYNSSNQSEIIRQYNSLYPNIRHGNYVISFDNNFIKDINNNNAQITCLSITSIKINDILTESYTQDKFPTLRDGQYLLKRLLNRSFHLLMKKNRTFWYELSSKRNSYYFPNSVKEKTSYMYNGKTKRKNLSGNFRHSQGKNGYWHFAISSQTLLIPFLCFSLKSHILFSDDGKYIWGDKSKLHSARRKKGKRWFNEEWRDQLLAFISSLKDSENNIVIELNRDFTLRLADTTVMFDTDKDYKEPSTKERENILSEDFTDNDTGTDL